MNKINFLKTAYKIHKNKYNYTYIEYKYKKSKIKIFCNKCCIFFTQAADAHLLGRGCPKCAIIKTHNKQRLSKKEFIKTSKKIHGKKYKYDKIVYINNKTKIKIYCNTCKKYFYQRPDAHIYQKQGCPICGIYSKSGINHHRYIQDRSKISLYEEIRRKSKKYTIRYKKEHPSEVFPGCHVDHIIPIIAFLDHGYGLESIHIINDFSNLKILSRYENLHKCGNYSEKMFKKYISKFNKN